MQTHISGGVDCICHPQCKWQFTDNYWLTENNNVLIGQSNVNSKAIMLHSVTWQSKIWLCCKGHRHNDPQALHTQVYHGKYTHRPLSTHSIPTSPNTLTPLPNPFRVYVADIDTPHPHTSTVPPSLCHTHTPTHTYTHTHLESVAQCMA